MGLCDMHGMWLDLIHAAGMLISILMCFMGTATHVVDLHPLLASFLAAEPALSLLRARFLIWGLCIRWGLGDLG